MSSACCEPVVITISSALDVEAARRSRFAIASRSGR